MIQRIALLSIACLASISAGVADDAHRPNFLIILADDVGRDAVGCYGGQSYPTPHIDALAETGLRFDHGYVMPSCHPTRITLLSGKYPFRTGHARWGSYPSDEENRTFAARLREAGYATAVAGKWQLSLLTKNPDQPHRMGFDEYCLFGWHEGPRYWQPMLIQNGTIRDDVADRYGPDVYVEFLTEFIENHREVPFLAYYPMALCHDVTDDLDEPVPYGPGKDRYEDYAEMMREMDERVGQIVAVLDRLDLREDTMILFLGDNGTPARSIIRAEDGKYIREPVYSETTWGRVQGGKTQLTDSGTRVPWIVNWPGHVEAGGVTDALVDASDLLPTLLELAGVDLEDSGAIDGQSFARTLTDPTHSARDWVFAEARGKSWVADQRWKLYTDGRLFDRNADPLEKAPVKNPSSPEAQDAIARLRSIHKSLDRK
ncbi:MAG: Cerebroside-sulfatase [Planctomycetota bacterium]|nr:MAG: Cerebroside-sulfatase [Planctomycetota bacterium]REJ91931.1 MAG: Cerebroside-sulfatase [Planctomycetota bacterium]REK27343.1 MAG: Cerebroside-sulfatase [Planctomycetota bacterium]REK36635.1 MAG: Cerebroside-sulfatase [Planctomycetota bacterium]